MRFSDIPGQESVKDSLRRLKSTEHLPHALMISGPRGAGKMMLARAFAQYLHCENPHDGDSCGVCNSCRMHADLEHPDMHFVYPVVKSKTKGIYISADEAEHWVKMLRNYPTMPEEKWIEVIEAGNSQPVIYVEEAAEIVRADAYPPISTEKKIFLIWLPEKLNTDTANKLLKVIEEPSDSTIFIMVSDNELQVLPTIFSRVQRIRASRYSDAEMEKLLKDCYNFGEAEAMRFAPLCEGSLIKAEEFVQESSETEEFLKMYQDVMRAAYAKKPAMLRKLADSVAGYGREKIRRFLTYMSRMIRENYIYNLRMPTLTLLTPEEEAFSSRFSPFVNHANVEDFMSETDRARKDIERNANARLVLFDYFLMVIILLHRKT